jgi:hypothetical protein
MKSISLPQCIGRLDARRDFEFRLDGECGDGGDGAGEEEEEFWEGGHG